MIKRSLLLSSIVLSSLYSTQSSATIFNIDAMDINLGTITRNFLPTPDTITLSLTTNTDLVSGYINKNTTGNGEPISISPFGAPGSSVTPPQYVYTAASNINHNGHASAPADGTHIGGSAPSGIVDDVTGTITMDLSSWFANHGGMDQNLGSSNATGTWDAVTGDYDLSWTATLTQGMAVGGTVTWNLQGNTLQTSPVPVPGAIWLMGTALLGLQRMRSKKVTA